MRNFTEEETNIINEYYDGVPVSEIAGNRDVSREYVYKILRKLPDWENLKENMKKNKKVVLDKETERKCRLAMEHIKKGSTEREATEMYSISKYTLYKYFPEMKGYASRRSKRLTQNIVDDWNKGLSYYKIMDKYGTYISDIYRRISSYYGDDWPKAQIRRAKATGRKTSPQLEQE